ncbi:GAF domain-containing protein [Roseomonas sp. GCM10028921]
MGIINVDQTTRAPIGLVSVVDEDRQFFKSATNTGTSELPPGGEIALPLSLCRYAVISGTPLILEDAANHEVFGAHRAIRESGIAAYASIPIRLEGHVIGTLCVFDSVPRSWTPEQLDSLRSLADRTATTIARKMRETDQAIDSTLGGGAVSPADHLAAAVHFFL